MTAGDNSLFGTAGLRPAPEDVAGIPGQTRNPEASDAALAADGYGWLAALLPAPAAPDCGGCGAAMRLPATSPVLWACPRCHPGEAA